jgi:primosomal protein N' (replication factor Y)
MESFMSDALQTKELKKRVAKVTLDQCLSKTLDYLVPEHLREQIEVGMRVIVPLRGNPKEGTVTELCSESSFSTLAPLAEIVSKPLVSSNLLQLASWVASYYLAPLRKVLKLLVPSPIRENKSQKKRSLIHCLKSKEELRVLSSSLRIKKRAQARILDVFLKSEQNKLLLTEILESSKTSKSQIETLIELGVLSEEKITLEDLATAQYFISKPKVLNSEQEKAFDAIANSLNEEVFSPFLLQGITGSGKTEVYMQAIRRALSLQYGALILFPEVALTTQMIERFRSRFSEKIGIYHYRLSDGERADLWNRVEKGEIQIVLGARSSIFLPVKNLKLIIVDEEHETSYKQEESPCFNARDVAVMRAKLLKATVVLGSATPSLESYYNALKGKYTHLKLTQRPKCALLPKIHLIDMNREREKNKKLYIFSDPLLTAIKKRAEAGEQSLIFLNRRGYHTSLVCNSCQGCSMCPHCDISLTYHKKIHHLRCHLCDYTLNSIPKSCAQCGGSSQMLFKGFGTELVEAQLKKIFPQIRTLRMDADTTRHKGSHEILLKSFKSAKADVLIGTQMIAKGVDFPSVTLVGVLNADQSLHSPDFRASEHLFQLLTQVSGRAGRAQLHGEVMIQTYLPSHSLFSHLKNEDLKSFYEEEMKSRELFYYPPYSHIAKLMFSSQDEQKAKEITHFYREKLLKDLPSTFELLAVVPEVIAKLKGEYRFSFLVKGPSMTLFSKTTQHLLDHHPLPSSIKSLIEVDH